MSLLAGDDPAAGRRAVLKRALFLAVRGYLFALIWPADILHDYAAYFLVALPLLAALVLLFPVLVLFGPAWETGWDFDTLEYEGFWTLGGQLRHLLYNGFHPVVPWAAFLVYGLWLGRRVRARGVALAPRMFVIGALVGAFVEVAAWLVVRAIGPREQNEVAQLFTTASMPPFPPYVVAAAAEATAVLGACLWIAERWRAAGWLRPLVHTGQLALTLYCAHVVIGIGPFEGRLGQLATGSAVAWWALFCALAVGACHLWRLRFARGPLEALMRQLVR